MGDALGFDSQRDLIDHVMGQIGEGHCLEFGVFTGGTIRYMAKKLRTRSRQAPRIKSAKTQFLPEIDIHGFDSFEGLPEAWGGFSLGKRAFDVGGKLPKVPGNVALHKGWFEKTLPAWLAANPGPIAFVHIDCDLYSSTVTILEGIRERLQPGSIILFDEYFNYPGWERHEFKAWREFVDKYAIAYEYIGYARQQVAVRISGH